MSRYSHQFLVAVTVENTDPDPDKVTELEMIAALHRRVQDVINHDGCEAFGHNDTEEI